MVITRFAPSPTGLLHIGNVRTALICYLFAKSQGGQFMLRLDDTDEERSQEAFAIQIQESLQWLGLQWDIFARQSQRRARYEAICKQLEAMGRFYPCYETEEELEVKRKMQLSRGKPPIYDRAALSLTEKDRKQLEAKSKKPHWRFKLDDTATITWNDAIRGPISFEAKHLSDPILIRETGAPTYMLPSTVDDIDFKISHIIRGEDHITNTAIQLQIFEALGATPPGLAHHSLLKSKEGKISKRKGGFDISSLKDEGIEPMAITSFLARLGTSEPIEPRTSIQQLIEHFNIKTLSRAPAIYDTLELERLNTRVIHNLSYQDIKTRLTALGLGALDEAFWLSVRPNLHRFVDIVEWWHICKKPLEPVIAEADKAFMVEASKTLPLGPWDETTWKNWSETLKQQTGRTGKTLFLPLRLALTARPHGPEIHYLLPLIGYEKTMARLHGEKA